MITTKDRTLNLERIAHGVGKTHDDWVNASPYWNNDSREISRAQQILMMAEKSPKGWSGTVEKMKKHPEIDNPFALARYMKNKGYKSHKTTTGKDK